MKLILKASFLISTVAVAAIFSNITSAQTTDTLDNAVPPVEVFYVTDRAPLPLEDGSTSYGASRSHSLAFGSVSVWGKDASAASLSAPNEIGRFPKTPYKIEHANGFAQRDGSITAEHTKTMALMKKELSARIKEKKRHEAVVFIHGYNNSFDDAARSAAQLCNDLGPEDYLCIALTWPAGGSKGVLFGYNVDRESGEFAVADIRKAIRAIGATPGLHKLHFVAHSRGTDVLATAFQQLAIEAYASQSSFASQLKIANVILAAPDMDMDVAFTRVLGVVSDPETLHGNKPDYKAKFKYGDMHLTVYASHKDKALELSKALFGSEERLGLLDSSANASEIDLVANAAGITDFVSVENGGGFIGHSYFLSTPEVRADLAAVIKDGKRPGDEGRSLVEVRPPFWILPSRQQ